MDAKSSTASRLDQLDAERFEAMVTSPLFALIFARVAGQLERARTDCEIAVDAREVRMAQGRAAALRVVLQLPATMLKEMKAPAKK